MTCRTCSPSAASSSATRRSEQWCTKFGAGFAAGLRRGRVRAGDKWHLDEVALKIRGKRHWLWRAVDQHGVVLDILVPERRDQAAAERFLHRVLDGENGAEPRVVITDKLASYPPAIRQVLPHAEHRRHKRLNNRAENSHLPTRKRERVLQRFKSGEHAQRFLGPFSAVSNHFRRVDTSSPLPPTDRSAPRHTPPGRTPLRLAFDSETGHPGGLAPLATSRLAVRNKLTTPGVEQDQRPQLEEIEMGEVEHASVDVWAQARICRARTRQSRGTRRS